MSHFYANGPIAYYYGQLFVNGEPMKPLSSAVGFRVQGVVRGLKFNDAQNGCYFFKVLIDNTWYGFSESYGKLTRCVFADGPEVKDTDYKVRDGFLAWNGRRISNGAAIQTFVDAKTGELEAELEIAKEEAEEDAAQADEAWQECNDQEEDMRTVEAEYQGQIAELKAENAKLQAENARLKAEKAKLEAYRDTVQEHESHYKDAVARLEEEKTRLEEEKARLEEEKARLKKRAGIRQKRKLEGKEIKKRKRSGDSREAKAKKAKAKKAKAEKAKKAKAEKAKKAKAEKAKKAKAEKAEIQAAEKAFDIACRCESMAPEVASFDLPCSKSEWKLMQRWGFAHRAWDSWTVSGNSACAFLCKQFPDRRKELYCSRKMAIDDDWEEDMVEKDDWSWIEPHVKDLREEYALRMLKKGDCPMYVTPLLEWAKSNPQWKTQWKTQCKTQSSTDLHFVVAEMYGKK